MSIALVLCLLPLLVHGLAGPARVRALVQAQARSSYLDNLPGCAMGCVLNFASASFPGCAVDDLPCQCTSTSKTGFALGEGSLRCLITDCPMQSRTTLESFYQICHDIPNAQPLTHATLTASMQKASTFQLPNPGRTTSISSSVSSSTTSRRHSSTHQSTTTHHSSSHTSTSHHSTFQTRTTPTFTPTPGIAQSAGAATPQIAPLASGQIAGIVIAAVVIVGMIIGLVFCVCRPRRKKARASIASFGLGRKGAGHDIPSTPRLPPGMSSDDISKPAAVLGIPTNPAQKRWTLWRMAMKNPPPKAEGYAASATEQYGPVFVGATHESSPMSVKSYQTTSQLLPDKPTMAGAAFPPHLAKKASDRSLTDRSANGPWAGRFAPNADLPTIASESDESLQHRNMTQGTRQQQTLRSMPSDPFIDDAYSESAVPAALNLRRASNRDLPRINTGAERSLPSANNALMPGVFPPGPYPLQSRHAQTHVSPQPNSHDDAYFTNAIANRAAPSQFNKWAPLRAAPNTRARPLTHLTTGSDTSFEDDGDTPPEAPAMITTLTPVAESPAGGVLLARHAPSEAASGGPQIYYPAVPGTGASRKQLRVTMRGDDASPTHPHPPVRSQFRPRLEDAHTTRQPYGATTHAPAPYHAYRPSTPPRNDSLPPRTNEHLHNEQTPRSFELPDTSPAAARSPPGSPNFSRPQVPPMARLQRPHEDRGPVYGRALGTARAGGGAPAKFQIQSSPGMHGETETWGGPIEPPSMGNHHHQQRPFLRPALTQIPPKFPPPPRQPQKQQQQQGGPRGTWRGKHAPIGAQWRQ